MCSRWTEKEQNEKSVCPLACLGVREHIRVCREVLGTVGKPRPLRHIHSGVYFKCRDGVTGNRINYIGWSYESITT